MKKFLNLIFVLFAGISLMSCLGGKNEASVYQEAYSVVKSSATTNYFLSDDGYALVPKNNAWDTAWGKSGDRVLISFYYNPYAVSESNRVYIDLSQYAKLKIHNSALPSTADSVMTKKFVSNETYGPFIWATQDFLTARFVINGVDVSKHSFGFIETPELFRNDTLFLRLWHNSSENEDNKTILSHFAMKLDRYMDYLQSRDTTFIAVKYKAENQDAEKTAITRYVRPDYGFGY